MECDEGIETMKAFRALVALTLSFPCANVAAQKIATPASQSSIGICAGGGVQRLVVRGAESKFTVFIHPAHWTKLEGPAGFLSFFGDQLPSWVRHERWSADALDLRPKKRAKKTNLSPSR